MKSARPALSVAALLALLAASGPASAVAIRPPDRQAPTRPNNLRMTGNTPYSVSLAWNASSDNSGRWSYVIQASNGYTLSVPQTSTAATFSLNLFPHNTYSFSVYAVDDDGNRSNSSNTVRTTLGADTTAPGAPTVTVTDTGPTHVSLSWSATDNDPYLSYFVYINGVQAGFSTTQHTGIFYPLQPTTSYTVTVKARDHGINWSPLSAPLVFTTDAVDHTDTTPPTAPTGVDAFHYPADREIMLSWTQSTDNVDIPQALRYEVFVNGVLSENVYGVGSTTTYGVFGHNVISVIAIDTAGNRSEAGTVETDI